MASTTFSNGTVVMPDWLNDVNTATYKVNIYDSIGDAIVADPDSLTFPSGAYSITSNTTFTMPVYMEPGAVMTIASGITVTFNGGFYAGVYQVFAGSGTVVFDWTKTYKGYAEWWGAKADLSVDCTPAINAAIVALQTTQLMAGDYLCNTSILMQVPHRYLIGTCSKYNDIVHTATRILTNSGSQYGMVVGPSTFPGSINDLQQDNLVEDIYFNRAIDPVISSDCVGLEVQYCLYCRVKNVKIAESIIGFRSFGNVSSKFDDIESVRSRPGTGTGTDYWRGFHLDGSASIGASGGNASIYLNRAAAGCNILALQTTTGVGYYIDQAFTDVFLNEPESVNCYIGIQVVGNGATGNTFSNTDLTIKHPVMDQFHYVGIYVTTVAEAGSLQINDPYCGPATDARASIWINSSPAAVTISGGQLVHGGAPNVQPIIILNSSGVQLNGTIILETGNTYAVVGVSSSTNCFIRPTIKNKSVTGQAAVQLTGTVSACVIEPLILGKASAFTIGIQVVGTADSRNEYRLTGIDSGCISAGSANKLTRNGVQITATGLTGTNLVSGVTT